MAAPARLHADVHEGQGPWALFVHGLLSSRAQWAANLAVLTQHCRPVVVELWGHGRSPAPDEPDCYLPAAYAEQFELLRASLGIERWLVVGQSLGAALTIRYALDHPRQVVGQVFTNSTSALGPPPLAARAEEAGGFAERLREGGRAALERIPVHPRHARSLPEPWRSALLDDAARLDAGGVANGLLYTAPKASVRARLAENRVPSLLVAGSREHRFQPLARHAAQVMPQLTTVPVDAGHAVNIEAAADFHAALAKFIS